MQHKVANFRKPTISQWHDTESKGAMIFVDHRANISKIAPYFVSRLARIPQSELPGESRGLLKLSFSTLGPDLIIQIKSRAQDKGADLAVDSMAKGIMSLCRKGQPITPRG